MIMETWKCSLRGTVGVNGGKGYTARGDAAFHATLSLFKQRVSIDYNPFHCNNYGTSGETHLTVRFIYEYLR